MMKKLISIIFLATLLSACASQTGFSKENNQLQRNQQASKINVELGLSYLERKQVPRAKEKLLLAVRQNPKSVTALDAMAYFWEVTGNNRLANNYYKQAISIEPKSGRALNNYGAYLCRIKQYNSGEKYLLAAANQPNYIESAAAMENAGLCQLGIPNIKQAEIYFKKAIQQDPNLITSYYELAQINYNQGNYAAAKKYLKSYNATGKFSAASLWLEIQLAKTTKNVATMRLYGALLEQQFPNSKQYKLYQKMQIS